MVEFALFFMLYLTLLLGLLELGRLVWTVATLSYAAREGARYATVHGSGNPDTDDQGQTITAASITSIVKGRAIGLDKQLIEVESVWDPDDLRGSLVRVQVEYSFHPLFFHFLILSNLLRKPYLSFFGFLELQKFLIFVFLKRLLVRFI